RLDIDRDELAALVAATGADGDDLALHGLLLSGVGDDDAALGLTVFLDSADDYAVVERTELHGARSLIDQVPGSRASAVGRAFCAMFHLWQVRWQSEAVSASALRNTWCAAYRSARESLRESYNNRLAMRCDEEEAFTGCDRGQSGLGEVLALAPTKC